MKATKQDLKRGILNKLAAEGVNIDKATHSQLVKALGRTVLPRQMIALAKEIQRERKQKRTSARLTKR